MRDLFAQVKKGVESSHSLLASILYLTGGEAKESGFVKAAIQKS